MKDTQYNCRMNSEFKSAAKKYANSTGRSLGGLINYLLEKEMDEAGFKYKKENSDDNKSNKNK